jgi:hypothetical protein
MTSEKQYQTRPAVSRNRSMSAEQSRRLLAIVILLVVGTVASGQSRNLAPDPSFEDASTGAPWSGGFALDASVACTGQRSARLTFSADKSPSVAIGDLHVIEPNRHYRVRAMTRTDLSGQGLRLRVHLKDAAGNFTLTRVAETGAKHGWEPLELKFTSGQHDKRIWFCVEGNGHPSGTAWVDDILLVERAIGRGPLKENRLALLTDEPAGPVVLSLDDMNPDRLRVLGLGAAPEELAELETFKVVVLFTSGTDTATEQVRKLRPQLRAWTASGKVVFLDLGDWAVLHGMKCETSTLPDEQREPKLSAQQLAQLTEAIGKVYGKKVVERADFTETWMQNAFAAYTQELREPVLRLRIVADDKATQGFPQGTLVPWCGSIQGQWQHRWVPKGNLPAGVSVLAETETGCGASVIKETIGQGAIYAADLASLDEPYWNWATRTSTYKYVLLGNLVNDSIRFGRHWSRRPTYGEFVEEMRRLGAKYPRLGFRLLGHEKTGADRCYRIYGFAFGNLAKPAYVYTAALHAEDEWTTSLAAWSLAEWFGRNLDDPRVQRKLAEHSVVIVPMAWPTANLGSLGTAPGPDPIPAASELPERLPPVFYAYQMHLAGGPLSIVLTTIPGVNQDWSELIGQGAALHYRDRYAYWSATEGPQQPLTGRVVYPMPPSWYGYFRHPAMYQNVFTCEQVQQAQNFALSEATRHGYWPDSLSGHYLLRSVFWDWFPHDLAFTTDIQVQLAVEAFLAEPPSPMPPVVFPPR